MGRDGLLDANVDACVAQALLALALSCHNR